MDTEQALGLQGIIQFPWMIFSVVTMLREVDIELQAVRDLMESNISSHHSLKRMKQLQLMMDGLLITLHRDIHPHLS